MKALSNQTGNDKQKTHEHQITIINTYNDSIINGYIYIYILKQNQNHLEIEGVLSSMFFLPGEFWLNNLIFSSVLEDFEALLPGAGFWLTASNGEESLQLLCWSQMLHVWTIFLQLA